MKRPAYRSSNMIQYDEYDYPHNILASYSKKKKNLRLQKPSKWISSFNSILLSIYNPTDFAPDPCSSACQNDTYNQAHSSKCKSIYQKKQKKKYFVFEK